MKKMATMGDLISALDKVGWEKGFKRILEMHKALENQHAFLASGDYLEQTRASKLMTQIAEQDITLVRLQIFAKEQRGIILDGRH